MAINAAKHSMIWINPGEMPSEYLGKSEGVNRLGSFMGVMGQSQMDMSGSEPVLDLGDRITSVKFGQRIAEATSANSDAYKSGTTANSNEDRAT